MKVLLPVDGSADSLAAVQYALQLSQLGLLASFVLVNVQPSASLYEMVVAHDADVIARVRGDAGADQLAAAEALLEAAGVEYESEVAGGEPETLLLELLENYGCDAIMVGARGLDHAASSGIGHVAHALLLHSAVPVTLVRQAPANEAE
ncbi:MAG: universal stress protein [Rubrivivax sp.]|nr:universal stress protein [Rubrivivax sp.]